jgi:acyl-CoA dehydrogenase
MTVLEGGTTMNENEEELRGLVDDIVAGHSGADVAAGRAAVWRDLQEAGLHRIGIAESAGGSGGSFDDLSVVAHALGARGMRTPLIESAVADRVRSAAGTLDERWGSVAAPGSRLVTWSDAEFVIVSDGDAARIVDAPMEPAGLDVSGVPLGRVADAAIGASVPLPADALASWNALVIAALAGAAEGIYVRTRKFVGEREQFGRALIAVPAVQNRLGGMKMRLVQIRAAAELVRENREERALSAARVVISTGASALAAQAHQLHGAIGITREFGLWPLTSSVWALRDQPDAAHRSAARLGVAAAAGTEQVLWDELTAW